MYHGIGNILVEACCNIKGFTLQIGHVQITCLLSYCKKTSIMTKPHSKRKRLFELPTMT